MANYNLTDHFRVRGDERNGLRALFERAFFDVPYSEEAVQALTRIEYRPEELESVGESGPARFGDLPRTSLLYRGERGIGKSRIFRQFRSYAEERHIPVYEIHCYDVEGIPFKPFLRVIREILRDFEFEDILREKYRAGLERLLPEIFQSEESLDPSFTPRAWDREEWEQLERDRGDKIRIFEGITQLLFEITAAHPVIILVHDLSWGDQATIELLRYIGRNIQLRNFGVPSWSGKDGRPYTDLDWLAEEDSQDAPEGLELSSFSASAAHTFLDSEGDIAGRAADRSASTPDSRPVRLMILGNYEGARCSDDYLERSLSKLSAEPFAYHGEIRTLSPEETRQFVRSSLGWREGVGEEGGIEIDDSAIDRLHEISQGFPGFIHEALRVLLNEGGEAPPPDRIDAALVETCLADSPPRPGGTPEAVETSAEEEQAAVASGADSEEGSDKVLAVAVADRAVADRAVADVADRAELTPTASTAGDQGASASHIAAATVDASPGGEKSEAASASIPAARLRYRILQRRLRQVGADELDVLRALALARKPLTVGFLSTVLERSADEIESLLEHLVERCKLERVGHLFPRGGEGDGFHFRIGGYCDVVAHTIKDPEQRRQLHESIGRALAESSAVYEEEKAFEIFHHLSRGSDPRAALEFGLVAARRFARSFCLEKAIHVLEDLLEIVDRTDDPDTRVQLLEQRAAYYLSLEDYTAAEASVRTILEDPDSVPDEARKAELLISASDIQRKAGETNRALKSLSKAFRSIKDAGSMLAVRWHLASALVRRDRRDTKRGINLCLKGIKICQKIIDASIVDDSTDRPADPQDDTPRRPRPETWELSELQRCLAETFWQRGDDVHAVDNFQRALNGFERLHDEVRSAEALDDLGNVYLERGNYFRAARYFYKALEIKRRNQEIHGLCKSYDELGLVYLRTGDEIKTIGLLNQSIHLKETIGDLEGLNPTLGTLGELYFRLGRYEKANSYFQRQIRNTQALKDTTGLVDAFTRLGWVCHEIGDSERVEELTRQIGILSTEFKLRPQEAGGARLRGMHEALRRNWDEAEAQLKTSTEIYAKLGDRRREAEALLDQASIRYAREKYDEALKSASKAVVVADQLKSVDLQVRGLCVKGNIYRFLKRGNAEKAKELLRTALELARNISDVHLLFDVYYSLAKVYHYDRDFVEAGSFYAKAEAILRRIGDSLPDDLSARYLEHPYRKTFLDDAARYRKEVRGRTEMATGDPRERLTSLAPSVREDRGLAQSDYEDLNRRALRVSAAQHFPEFFDILLREANDLVQSERSCVLSVKNRQYKLMARSGFGETPAENPEFPSAQAITEDCIRKGKAVLLSTDDLGKERRFPHAASLVKRSLLVVPLRTAERIFGALYLDRPLSLGRFSSSEQTLIETLAAHAGCALENRRRYESAIVEPLTGLRSTSYFLERLKEAYRHNNLHGRPFFLLGFYMPTLESSMKDGSRVLGERLVIELQEELPPLATASWGSPILSILLQDIDFGAVDRLAQRLEGRLLGLINCRVQYEVLSADARLPSGLAVYNDLRRRLLPEESDQQTILEIRQLLARDITLKDAKQILERHIIENTLKKTGGNITHAAKELGIHRPQLSNLLKKHSLKRERFEREVHFDIDPDAN